MNCLQRPLTYSFNFITFVSMLPIPPSGHLDLFTMRGGLFPTPIKPPFPRSGPRILIRFHAFLFRSSLVGYGISIRAGPFVCQSSSSSRAGHQRLFPIEKFRMESSRHSSSQAHTGTSRTGTPAHHESLPQRSFRRRRRGQAFHSRFRIRILICFPSLVR